MIGKTKDTYKRKKKNKLRKGKKKKKKKKVTRIKVTRNWNTPLSHTVIVSNTKPLRYKYNNSVYNIFASGPESDSKPHTPAWRGYKNPCLPTKVKEVGTHSTRAHVFHPWIPHVQTITFKEELHTRTLKNSKEREKYSPQNSAKIMKIGQETRELWHSETSHSPRKHPPTSPHEHSNERADDVMPSQLFICTVYETSKILDF